jgi:uncharacterized membrane protein
MDAVAERPRSRFLVGRLLRARPRLFLSLAVAIACYLLWPRDVVWVTRVLIAWNIGTCLYIALYLVMIAKSDNRTIRWRARVTDEGKFVILILTTVAATASLVAIFAQLAITKDLKGFDKGLHLGLAGLTIVSAWVFIHLSFALHYAHEFFDEHKTLAGETAAIVGGLNFPGTDEPDYWDFLYFSFIVGVASQTADVSITSKAMRRTSLAHSILAFFFNSAILALTINIAAGLI